jgi:riboflavin synthase alpha subunit
VTLEPCAHESERGPACVDLLVKAKPARVVIALKDPDPRTSGKGIKRLREAGIEVKVGTGRKPAAESLAGYLTRLKLGRPRITLKLALSIDGKIALPSGESKWITGEDARAHVHFERAHCDMILVGRGTYHGRPAAARRSPSGPRGTLAEARTADPRREAVEGWEMLSSPQDVHRLHDVNDLLVEGGSATATAFLSEDLVDRILIYRAPIIVGEGQVVVRLCRPRRDRRRARQMALGRRSKGWGSTGSKFTSGCAKELGGRRMFTGIVTDVGTVVSAEQRSDLRLRIRCGYDMSSIDLGASIACSGVCLTVVDKGPEEGGCWFAVDLSTETLSRTAADLWREGAKVNLERPLRVGDELGGHFVTGHVDCVGDVLEVHSEGGSTRVAVRVPKKLAPLIAAKGSVALDGVSLTVNDAGEARTGERNFRSTSSPHRQHTTLGDIAPGRQFNVEADVLARYIDRMIAARSQ